MALKIYNEAKELPQTPFLMMVVTEDGKEHPYYATEVHKGNISNIPIIEGGFLEDIIQDPVKILDFESGSIVHQGLYIDKKRKHPGVKYYRVITREEVTFWKEKLGPLMFDDLPKSISKEYEKNNNKAKRLFTALYRML